MKPQTEKKEAVLQAATRRFLRLGVRKTTLSDVSKDVGFSVQNFFKDKDSLIIACLDFYHLTHLKEAKRIAESNLHPFAKLKIYILNRYYAWKEWHDSTPQSLEFISVLIRLSPERFSDEEKLLEQTIRRILQIGVSVKKLKMEYPERDAHMLCLSLTSFFPLAGLRRPHEPTEKDLLELLEWFGGYWRKRN